MTLNERKEYNVSVVVCTKDRPLELISCICSILKQDYPFLEIIIIDASSNKEALNILFQEIPDKDRFLIKYIHSKAHYSYQKNIGIKQSTGDIVLFIDDDVEIKDNFIRNIIKVFKYNAYKRVGGVTGCDISVKRIPKLSLRNLTRTLFFLNNYGNGRFRLSRLHTSPVGLRGIRKTDFLPGAYTAYRKEVLIEVGLLDENFEGHSPFEDVDLSYRVSRKYLNYYTEYAKCIHKASLKSRLSIDKYNERILGSYRYYFNKDIQKNIFASMAYKIASWGIEKKFYYMTEEDIVLFFLRKLFNDSLTEKLIQLKRRIIKFNNNEVKK